MEGAEYLEVRQQPACAEANVKNFRLATGSDGCTHTRFELGSRPRIRQAKCYAYGYPYRVGLLSAMATTKPGRGSTRTVNR